MNKIAALIGQANDQYHKNLDLVPSLMRGSTQSAEKKQASDIHKKLLQQMNYYR